MRLPVLLSLACAAMAQVSRPTTPQITPATDGPYHVRGTRIFDAHDREYLIRGTRLPIVDLNTKPSGFGPFSGTTFITIRQRMNMNAVRFLVDAYLFQTSEPYRARVIRIVEEVNRFQLLAILETAADSPSFWTTCAAAFKSNPNVFFALSSDSVKPLIEAIRSTGAVQPSPRAKPASR